MQLWIILALLLGCFALLILYRELVERIVHTMLYAAIAFAIIWVVLTAAGIYLTFLELEYFVLAAQAITLVISVVQWRKDSG